MKPDTAPQALLDAIDGDTMLREVQDWAAINTGTGNIAGLDRMAGILADAFSTLPGDVDLVEPATVTAISPEGREFEKPHGRHMVLRVRPEAKRRFVLCWRSQDACLTCLAAKALPPFTLRLTVVTRLASQP